MPKNIIICCDGTNNKFGRKNSNVVKLFSILKNSNEQICYYDPGVGTMADTGWLSPIKKKLSIIFGQAFGLGLQKNVEEAYTYLMKNYEQSDNIYLFGFSRGAYTVRVLAGLIRMCGLMKKGSENLVPYAYEIYSRKNLDFKVGAQFKKRFGRPVSIHFMGIWDTVSSVGWVYNFKTYPYTAYNDDINIIRHALAIDEKRTFFTQNYLKEKEGDDRDVKQVWFTGVHSDVGGSYPEEESGLSKISLRWMIKEAELKGIEIDSGRYDRIVLGRGNNDYCEPDHNAMIHNSMSTGFLIAEFLPRKIKDYSTGKVSYKIPLQRPRVIPESALIHQSVFERMNQMDYKPENLPTNYIVEN
jgi:uncharacterized protein (DUF2235 family)